MNPSLHILHLEDNPADALLVRDLLQQDGLTAEIQLAANRAEFLREFPGKKWDVVISDYRLADFTGLDALRLVREKFSFLPFILISGNLGEKMAIESLKAGATDYVFKNNRDRLPSAVRRALAEAAERRRRQAAEEELRQSEQQYRLLFHGNPHPMWVADLADQKILEVNAAAVACYGYSRAEFLTMRQMDLLAPDAGRPLTGPETDAGLKAQTWRHRRQDGSTMEMEVVGSPISFHGREAALTMATDVTARRQAAHRSAQFSKLSHQLSAVTTAAEAAGYICGVADELFHWDDFALDLYSSARDEVVSLLTITTVEGRRVELAASPQPRHANTLVQRVLRRGAELISAGETGEKAGTTMVAPIHQGERVIGVLFVQSGRPHSYSPDDLTTLQTLADQCGGALQRARAAEELRHSEQRFRDLFDNSPDAVLVEDLQGRILDANTTACTLHGFSREQLIGKVAVAELVPPEHRAAAAAEFQKLATGEISWLESESLAADGRRVPVEVRVVRVEIKGRPALLFHVRDVTVQKRLEEQLRQSQKMEAIGQLAGGVAHDFNNILTIILGHASLLALTSLEPRALDSANQIKLASERAAGLTRQLLAFGRKQIVNPRPLDLNPVVQGLQEMLARLLGEDITMELELSGEPAVIEADPTMMEQVLINLSMNSRDAMPAGGRLAVRLSHCEVDELHLRKTAEAAPGRYVCLTHTDTGSGIPPENIGRIFEPFFTTKELGKGAGLGLATVHGLVKQHRGWIEVESGINQGTTFHIFLPATEARIPTPEDNQVQLRSLSGKETVLVVEDERDLREIVTRTLHRHGYRVFQAVDAHNALQIWGEYKSQIDLVFTDVIMPGGMNGRELAEKLWLEKPAQKVIFSTGYGAEALGKNFTLDPGLNYLQKPYLPNSLARIVRRCLDAKRN